jgi:hypothetical protein
MAENQAANQPTYKQIIIHVEMIIVVHGCCLVRGIMNAEKNISMKPMEQSEPFVLIKLFVCGVNKRNHFYKSTSAIVSMKRATQMKKIFIWKKMNSLFLFLFNEVLILLARYDIIYVLASYINALTECC